MVVLMQLLVFVTQHLHMCVLTWIWALRGIWVHSKGSFAGNFYTYPGVRSQVAQSYLTRPLARGHSQGHAGWPLTAGPSHWPCPELGWGECLCLSWPSFGRRGFICVTHAPSLATIMPEECQRLRPLKSTCYNGKGCGTEVILLPSHSHTMEMLNKKII